MSDSPDGLLEQLQGTACADSYSYRNTMATRDRDLDNDDGHYLIARIQIICKAGIGSKRFSFEETNHLKPPIKEFLPQSRLHGWQKEAHLSTYTANAQDKSKDSTSLTPATPRKLCHNRENPGAMMGHPRKGAAQRPLVAIFGLTGPDEFCLRGPGAPPTQNPRVARSASSDSAEDDDPMLDADVEETSNLGLFSVRTSSEPRPAPGAAART